MLKFCDWLFKRILVIFYGGILVLFELATCAVLGFFTAPWLGFALGFVWFLADMSIIKMFTDNQT